MKTYQTAQAEVVRLGDKEELLFELSETSSSAEDLLKSVSKIFEIDGTKPAEILESKDYGQLAAKLEDIRRELGLYAGSAQIDAYGFVKRLLQKL